MIRQILLLLPLLAAPTWVRAMEEITEAERARPPTASRAEALVQEAGRQGWGAVARQLQGVALELYEKNGPAALAWCYACRWAGLFSLTERQVVPAWIYAMNRAKAGHPNLNFKPPSGDRPLGEYLPADLQAYALGSVDFSEQFFDLVSPLDYLPNVFLILDELWRSDAKRFKDYAGLALAIAVVHDVPPPPTWPHSQVAPAALSRKLLPPAEAMDFFVKSDRSGATLHRVRRLPAAEIKFIVDVSAPPAEMDWAQKEVNIPLSSFAKAYDLVRYRSERVDAGQFIWPLPEYKLPLILEQGGICVDQAYFASTVGKARGVPTLLFRGAGFDGRHAWFGYLDGNGRWQLDAGRYAEQKLVAGTAYDPQKWTGINDHELKFLSEGFRRLPAYKTSWLHQCFAEEYARIGNLSAAARAARAAVNAESRNYSAWNLLIALRQRQGDEPGELEGLYQEAARAFARYPDVETGFKQLLIQSLRGRGQTSLADALERGAVRKYNQAERLDIGAQQADEILQRSLAQGDLAAGIRAYNDVLDSFGRGAGMEFFDRIVRPFADYLLAHGRPEEALQAATRARQTLRVEAGSQLDSEFGLLIEKIRKAQR